MNRRSFFGLFTLPLAIKPAKSADWGAGQPPHVVNNSARELLRVKSMTITVVGSGGAGWGPGVVVGSGGGSGGNGMYVTEVY